MELRLYNLTPKEIRERYKQAIKDLKPGETVAMVSSSGHTLHIAQCELLKDLKISTSDIPINKGIEFKLYIKVGVTCTM